MIDDAFEWDDAKAAANLAKHGVSFEMARDAFGDPFLIEWIDESANYGELRFCALGMVEGRLLFVAYTLRAGRVRIISARLAERGERRLYHNDGKA